MIARALLWLIRGYQLLLSPLLGRTCRFEPSCSHYTAACIERFGAVRGVWLARAASRAVTRFTPAATTPPQARDAHRSSAQRAALAAASRAHGR